MYHYKNLVQKSIDLYNRKMANADESPLVAVARLKVEQIVADRSQLAASDPGARFRLDQMIEHRNLFSSTGIS